MSREPNVAVHCIKCRKYVTAIVHGTWLDEYGPDSDYATRHTMGECPDCAQVLLFKHSSRPELLDESGYGQWWGDPELLYPTASTRLDPSVPPRIAQSYHEAAMSQSVGAQTATAIMCRRTLEGICVHYEARGSSLYERLKYLRDKGTIDARIYDWSDSVLRSLGNDAAHNIDEVISAEDAEAALEFTKAIIEYLFVFSAAFERFKERRKKGVSEPEGAT
jgi:hypothetical protein